MALDLDVSNAGVRAQELIQAPSSPIKDTPIYWGGATLPSPLPNSFIVIEPLYPTEWREWGEQRNATHTIQIRACAKSVGGSTSLRSSIANLLPPVEFGTLQHGPTIKVDAHYDSILTARTVAGESEVSSG